jgi:hypothetical protein
MKSESSWWRSVLVIFLVGLPIPFDCIFLSIRVGFQSSYGPCVRTCEVRYVAMKGSKSASGVGPWKWEGMSESKHAQMVWVGFPRESGPVKSHPLRATG